MAVRMRRSWMNPTVSSYALSRQRTGGSLPFPARTLASRVPVRVAMKAFRHLSLAHRVFVPRRGRAGVASAYIGELADAFADNSANLKAVPVPPTLLNVAYENAQR